MRMLVCAAVACMICDLKAGQEIYPSDSKAYCYLDQLALEAGADKASSYHNYTEVYAQYFDGIKELPIKFLEIGIDAGNSVKLWENYFKNAELHFIDITFERVRYFSDRSHYHLTNQQDPKALRALMQSCGGDFDIIIDDGGHMMQQQIVSFQTLFPYVSRGGMYIIEDLHTSYWPDWGQESSGRACRKRRDQMASPATTVTFLQALINDLNFVGATTARANHQNLETSFRDQLNIYQRDIESIHFYDSLVIIKKR